tara:strand:+ start:369 stop:1319 length:951 start_codon:yes stop_codon:yes gene_type:complete
MSGSIGQFLESNKDFNSSSGDNQQITQNIPVKVTGYEGDICVGYRVDTKEQVRVRFRDVTVKGDNKRIEIRDFADPANRKRFIDPNSESSHILFENCYLEDDGIWNSRWGTMLSKPKKEATVLTLNANISVVSAGDNKFISVQTIKKSYPVQDEVNFYNILKAGLTPTAYRSRPSVAFVFKDSTGSSFVHEFFPKMVEDENNLKVAKDPQLYIDEVYSTEKVQMLLQLLSKEDVSVKAFIMSTLNYGADTNGVVLGNSFKVNKIENEYKKEVDGKTLKLYKNTILAIRAREDGSVFLTSAEPVENNVAGLTLDSIE